jgi:hypothetical protein
VAVVYTEGVFREWKDNWVGKKERQNARECGFGGHIGTSSRRGSVGDGVVGLVGRKSKKNVGSPPIRMIKDFDRTGRT